MQKKMTKRKRIEKEVVSIPDKQATITLKEYKNAIGLCQDGNAYLEPLSQDSVKNMQFHNGTIRMPGTLSTLTDQDIEKLRTTEYVEKIDLTLLRIFYTIIHKEFEKSNFQCDISDIKLYVPDLLKSLGLKANRSQSQISEVLQKINEFKNLIGVIRRNKGGRIFISFYEVLNINYYDEEKNIISLSAPYLNIVVKMVHEASIRCKNGKKIMKKNGCPNTRASHSYLISLKIGKERNKAAVENVNIIVALIEMAGGTSAHISAETIVSRNVLLQKRLDECLPKNRNQILDRVFKKTWELLKAKTDLENVYPDIELPDPDDLKNIPTMQTISKVTFNFPHGKKKRKSNMNEK